MLRVKLNNFETFKMRLKPKIYLLLSMFVLIIITLTTGYLPTSVTYIDQHKLNSTIVETYEPRMNVTLLYWTLFHGKPDWFHSSDTPLRHQHGNCSCTYSYDKDQLATSDAVLIEYMHVTGLDESNENLDVPSVHKPSQYWILYNHEPPPQIHPIYSFLKPGIFNLSANYRAKADIVLSYGHCGLRTGSSFSTAGVNYAANKTGLVAWHVSNCKAPSKRYHNYVKELKKYLKVDIKGACGSSTMGYEQQTFVQNINNYKFYLSFENSFCEDYITEKVYKTLEDDVTVIPVVRGTGPYDRALPPGSYIDVADYESPKHLALHLLALDKNDTLYNEYFLPREKYICENNFRDLSVRQLWPRNICREVCRLKRDSITETLEMSEIEELFLPQKICSFP